MPSDSGRARPLLLALALLRLAACTERPEKPRLAAASAAADFAEASRLAKEARFDRAIASFEKDDARYARLARALHEALLAPVAARLTRPNLIVVPDGILTAVPFEALLTEAVGPAGAKDYSKLPYLLKQHAVSYTYSATLLLQTRKRQRPAPRRDFLAFAPVFDLLSLEADLVVLSACETGLGKLARGEGMLGLTRGFLYAGAANLLVSLWRVSDAPTADIMAAFYERMLGGRSKAQALREAKLDLMGRNPELAKPYYWSAFTLIGQ